MKKTFIVIIDTADTIHYGPTTLSQAKKFACELAESHGVEISDDFDDSLQLETEDGEVIIRVEELQKI